MSGKPRVLVVVSTFKWSHTDYLLALKEHVDLAVVYAEEHHQGAVANAGRWGIAAECIGSLETHSRQSVKDALAAVIRRFTPDIVHMMYYLHEGLTLLVRDIVRSEVRLVFECRDPVTTLWDFKERPDANRLEAAALAAADAYIFVSNALRAYLEQRHRMDFGSRVLIVPHAFAERTAGPIREKLSASSSRIHIALVGTAAPEPDDGRWYGDIIQRLVGLGLVVHSHFHEWEGLDLGIYRELDAQLPDYHFHPTVPFREGYLLSDVISRYDLMGVFHELGASRRNELATLEVCMPTKAVSAWHHGAIPVVCSDRYLGVAEYIKEFGIGFLVHEIEGLEHVLAEPRLLEQATDAALVHRHRFTHEYHAARIADFYFSI